MNHTNTAAEPPQKATAADENTNPFHQQIYPTLPSPNSSSAAHHDVNPFRHEPTTEAAAAAVYPNIDHPPQPENQPPAPQTSVKYVEEEDRTLAIPPPPPAEAGPSASCSSAPPAGEEEKWGTCVMGTPAVPTVHPDNKKAAFWGAAGEEAHLHHHPYLQYTPIDQTQRSSSSSAGGGPMENMLQVFNSWSHKAETMATNIWHNLKTGPSVPGAAWAKVNLRAKALTGGGFETLYKQTFATYPNEALRKTFACYLSTSTGPVPGTLYLSNFHAAFCSDRPLSFTAPSGQITWSYYKVMVPLPQIGAINPVVMRENPTEKYVHIVTLEGHDFWFMGFVNYEKACRHLTDAVSNLVASGVPLPPTPPQNAAPPAAACQP